MSQIRKALVIACSLAAVSGVAHADDHAVARRISGHGKLTSSHAKQLASKVSERMARAADAPPAMLDPLRAALSQALLGTPMPPDGISAAKVRLKLYAGLSEFALEAIFAPRPGAIASCVRDLDLSSKDCEALVAAAGEVSVAQAKRSAGGPAPAPVAMAPMRGAPPQAAGGRFGGGGHNQGYPQQQQGYARQAPPPQQQQGRFGGAAPQQQGRFGSAPPQQQGRFGSAPPQQQARVAPPAQQPVAVQQQQPSRFGGSAPAQQRFGTAAPAQAAPAAAPAYVAAAPMVAPVTTEDAAKRKEEYMAKRAEYMARKKQEFEDRKAKSIGGAAPASDGPSEAPAPAAAAAKPAAAAAKPAEAPTKAEVAKPAVAAAGKKAAAPELMDGPMAEPENELDADMKAAVGGKGTPPAAAPAPGGGKAGLDGDFLDGLLDDPTGGKKK